MKNVVQLLDKQEKCPIISHDWWELNIWIYTYIKLKLTLLTNANAPVNPESNTFSYWTIYRSDFATSINQNFVFSWTWPVIDWKGLRYLIILVVNVLTSSNTALNDKGLFWWQCWIIIIKCRSLISYSSCYSRPRHFIFEYIKFTSNMVWPRHTNRCNTIAMYMIRMIA